jgi:hypothetical protein
MAVQRVTGMFGRWSDLRRPGCSASMPATALRDALQPARKFPLVDDKLTTKRLALEAGLAVPELYGVVRFRAS